MPIGIGAALLGGSIFSGLLGAGASIYGSGQQASAEKNAIAAQQQMFGVAKNELQPFIDSGQNNLGWYNYLTGTGQAPGGATGGPTQYNPMNAPLTAPFTAASLAGTPGYQFTLGQGLKGVNNSYAAEGLGSSGAALKGAADYATGQASTTYNQQLQNYLQQNQQIANLLYQPVNTGLSAGSALASGAIQTGANVGSSMVGEGNALAGGAVGAASSISGGVNNALQYSMLQQLINARNNPATTVNNALPNGGGTFGAGAATPYLSNPFAATG